MLRKLFGWISIIFGLLCIIFLPSTNKYTPDKISHGIVIVGIFFIGLGIFLVKT
jgi:hypothetical protein